MAVLQNVDVILNTHASNLPVLVQNLGVNVLARAGVLQDGVDNEGAEVDLER